jgi:hypothetical protein
MVRITFDEIKKMKPKLYDSITSLLPASPFDLSDVEIVEYFPDINASEIEQLKLDILLITEIIVQIR